MPLSLSFPLLKHRFPDVLSNGSQYVERDEVIAGQKHAVAILVALDFEHAVAKCQHRGRQKRCRQSTASFTTNAILLRPSFMSSATFHCPIGRRGIL